MQADACPQAGPYGRLGKIAVQNLKLENRRNEQHAFFISEL
jgi:hypothetical protein